MINLKSDKKPYYDGLVRSRAQQGDQQFRDAPIESLNSVNSRLQTNYVQIIELLKQRKDLLVRKTEFMQKDNQQKMDSIARARNQDLKNEARILRDESVMGLLENADKLNSTKTLLQRISNQDTNQFQQTQKNKGKKYWDKFKESELQIQNRNRKYLAIIGDMQKITERERAVFQQIERYEVQIIHVLTRKERDYLRKAQQLNDQIEKRKSILKDNKLIKDKKKTELVELLSSLLDTVKYHEDITLSRNRQIQQLYNGNEGAEGFDQFFQNFEMVVQFKLDDTKIPENTFKKMSQLVSHYQTILQEVTKMREDQAHVFEQMGDIYRRNIKIALLERAYLSGLSTNRTDMLQLVKKCRQYRKLLGSLEEDRVRVGKQLSKVNQLNGFFYNQYKALSNESSRKHELRKELEQILAEQNQLQKSQKKKRNFQYEMSNLELKRKAIERQMEDCASKGNLNDYKVKVKELERVDKEIEALKQYESNQNMSFMENKLLAEVQLLNEKYSDIIREVIIEEQDINYTVFLSKLSKRLTLI